MMRLRKLLAMLVLTALPAPAAASPWGVPVAANPDMDMPRKPPPPPTPPPPTPSPPPSPSPPPPGPAPSPPPPQWPPMQWPPQWPVPQWPQWPSQPAPPAQPAPPSQPEPAPWPARPYRDHRYYSSIISLGVGFAVDVGSLPEVAPGFMVWLGVITERFRVEMVTNFFEEWRDDVSKFQVWGVGGRFCWRAAPSRYRAFRAGPGFSLWGCGGFEVGSIGFHANETDPVTGSRTYSGNSDTWGAMRADLEGRYQIARSIAAVVVHAGMVVPFGRPELLGPADDPFRHSPSPVVGRFGIALALGY
ncbi:MAG TPA: hypothetical protein VLS89_14290 [Candidatus Nanopelagicales bacterium]|nr:hypothetical protein [Candidatus Nanopelagicales bacterium]